MNYLVELWLKSWGIRTILLFLSSVLILFVPAIWKIKGWSDQSRMVAVIVLLGLFAWHVYETVPFAKDFYYKELVEAEVQVVSVRQRGSRGAGKYYEYTVDDGEGDRKLILLKYQGKVTQLEIGEQYVVEYYKNTGAIMNAERVEI